MINGIIQQCKKENGVNGTPEKQRFVCHLKSEQQLAQNRKRHLNMNDRHTQRKEKDHESLFVNGTAHFPVAHTNLA